MGMMTLALLAAAAYIFLRAVRTLRSSWWVKTALSAFILLAAFKFQIISVMGGEMYFAPDVPASVLIAGAWAFAAFLLYFFLLLAKNILLDLVKLFQFLIGKIRRRSWTAAPAEAIQVYDNRINLVLLVVAAALSAWGVKEGHRMPRVQELTVEVAALPSEAEGMRIAVLADLHVHQLLRASFVRGVVRQVQALKPDLILIAGDFVDGSVSARGEDLLPLKELSAPEGVYGVAGNHEYYSDYRAWRPFLVKELGIDMLDNRHILLRDGSLALVGVTDPAADFQGLEAPDFSAALQGIRQGVPVLLLAHRPSLARDAAARGVNLQFSGHTHGGMVLGLDRLVALFNAGFVSGQYRVGSTTLLVSNGTGIWNGFPVRLGAPAEILLVRLISGASAD